MVSKLLFKFWCCVYRTYTNQSDIQVLHESVELNSDIIAQVIKLMLCFMLFCMRDMFLINSDFFMFIFPI